MWLSILLLIIGLVLILWGASWLTDGASALARRMGISDLVVGLTVVAFGTSAPELVVSIISAIEGSAGLAIGNIVGSNIFNICAIIGLTALVRPVAVTRSITNDQIPLVIISALALWAFGSTPLLDGSVAILTRADGIVLLLFFAIFMSYTFHQVKSPEAGTEQVSEQPAEPQKKVWLALLMTAAGLGMLIYGGDMFVDAASTIARALGVSDAVVGLTIVAAGTSLPELATSIVAAVKGHSDMAVGNVIGSCIFNIFLVLGLSATVHPLPFGSIGQPDLLVLVVASAAFWICGRFFGKHVVNRLEGAALTLLYVGYLAWLVLNA